MVEGEKSAMSGTGATRVWSVRLVWSFWSVWFIWCAE